jgi:hypothetical protein
MNEEQADQLRKDLYNVGFLSHSVVEKEEANDESQNYAVFVTSQFDVFKPENASCDNCRNRIICLINQRLMEIMPIISVATFNMKISDEMKKTLAKQCERFEK